MSELESSLMKISKKTMVHGDMETASSMVWQFAGIVFSGE